jgi:hypothetical protein
VGTISTIAGGGPNNVPKLVANLPVSGIAQDSNGNFYLAGFSQVLKIDSTGTVTVFAGNGQSGFSGDGGPATQATLSSASFVAVDANNNVYIADSGDNLIRKVDATTNYISTVAGNYAGTICATATDSIGDGCPATSAILAAPLGISVDSAGNLFIPDTSNYVVREVSATTGIIETVAGIPGVSGTGAGSGPATSAHLPLVFNICLDSADNIYILDLYTSQILEVVAATGNIQVFAGNGSSGYNGDGISATTAELDYPEGVFADTAGNIFIADTGNSRIRIVGGSGIIQTLAGTGTAGFSGDGGAATAAEINQPSTMMLDGSGNMFIVDSYPDVRIREVFCADAALPCTPPTGSTAGEILTFAGNGSCCSSGDGYLATDAAVGEPVATTSDATGNYYLADLEDDVIRKVDETTGIISTIAGSAALGCGETGDGGVATNAQICRPAGLFVDGAGNVFFTDTTDAVVREIVAATGIIQTVAGGALPCPTATDAIGDGCPATSASLADPKGIFVDGSEDILIADTGNHVIREVVAATGIIQTIAGTPQTAGFGGDGGPATAAGALLSFPYAVYEDSSANLYIADAGNAIIREVQGPSGASPGTLQTVVGQPGVFGYTGDGMAPTLATTSGPVDVKLDAAGDIFFSDCGWELEEEQCNNVIREVSSATGLIQTVAGNGVFGYNGDGELAIKADLDNPAGIGLDPFGNLLIADYTNGRVRSVAGIAFNTAAGTNLTVTPVDSTTGTTPVTVTFSNATSAGVTSLTTGSTGPPAPTSFQLGTPAVYYNLSTTATYSGTITVCINYTGISFPGGTVALLHYGATGWTNITTSVNTVTMVVCGSTTSLSPFALFQPQAVAITPTITWPTPAAITYSTALSATQLDATANVPGTFVYSPPAGTVLGAGTQTLKVQFTPNDTTHYTVANSSVSLVVNQAPLTVTANNATMIYGGTLPAFTAGYSGFVNGDTAAVLSGSPSLTTTATSTSPVGMYTITATQGTLTAANYSFIFFNGTLTISKASPTITWNKPAAITYGTALSTTQLDATTNVPGTFAYSPAAGTVLGAGTSTLSVTFTPTDSTDYNTASASVAITVNKATSTTNLTSGPNPSSPGQTVTLTATIVPQLGGTATGSVTFTDSVAGSLGTASVAANVATLSTIALTSPGSHSITATYSGDSNVLGSTSGALTQTVSALLATTTTLVSSVNPSYVTQQVTFTATVIASNGTPATGTVTFEQGKTAVSTAALTNGVATYSVTFTTAGSRTFTAVYAANGPFLGSTSQSLVQRVRNLPAATTTVVTSSGSPSFVGQTVVFTAQITSTFGPIPNGGTVTFTDHRGTRIGIGTTSEGEATLSYWGLAAGSHLIRAAYPGNAEFAPSISAAIRQVVDKYPTSTSLVSSLNPSTYGQSVTLTATVTSTGPNSPTGSVTFTNGTTTLWTTWLDSSGVATLTLSHLPAGTLSLAAAYNGDTQSATSSGALSQTVNMAVTTTTVTSSKNPSTAGQSVEFTATVTSPTTTPTGTVTFSSGSTTLGTATLYGGRASLTTIALPVGADPITATYNGTANITGSSASLTQQVN